MDTLLKSISAVVLAGLLILLTVGLPVAFNTIKELKQDIAQTESTDNNPYSNTTEEKTTSNSIFLTKEYVHTGHEDVHIRPLQISMAYIHAHESTYTAFHGELHSPPPNFYT